MSESRSFIVKTELSSTSSANTDSLQRWIFAFCAMRFDLHQGQLVEECYPPGCLTHDEELEISYSSFPDSVTQHRNSSGIHDCIFFFRFHRPPESLSGNVNRATFSRYMYGYVHNRQRHDERLKRGVDQKSVVRLSHNPYSSVFRPLLQIVGPLYFDIGKKALEHIAFSTWSTPVPGKLMDLPIGNATLKVTLPPAHCLPKESGVSLENNSSVAPFLPNNQYIPQCLFHNSDVFGTFKGLLLQLIMGVVTHW